LTTWQRIKDVLNRYLPSKGVEIRILNLHNKRLTPEKEIEHLTLKALVIDKDTRTVGKKGNSWAVTHAEHWIGCVENNDHVQTRLLKQEGQNTFYILISKPEAIP